MYKTKIYRHTKFTPRILLRGVEFYRTKSTQKQEKEFIDDLTVSIGDERWTFDDLREFLVSYENDNVDWARLIFWWDGADIKLAVDFISRSTNVTVKSSSRAFIDEAFSTFDHAPPEEMSIANSVTPVTLPTTMVFIGHGRSKQWEKLKAHLQDKHNLDVLSYETGARAGHTIRDILDSMSNEASFALLVLTGEDKTKEGLRARQNVIHECGLFQGRLGFDRAILLVEKGIELASNFDGIQQLRFTKGRISEVFGDVVATIRREFGLL